MYDLILLLVSIYLAIYGIYLLLMWFVVRSKEHKCLTCSIVTGNIDFDIKHFVESLCLHMYWQGYITCDILLVLAKEIK